ncbi:MAG: superoxide dismutase [Bacteroidia bacterium]|nr:superoxide dismutase [Bacteroidia bacterium]
MKTSRRRFIQNSLVTAAASTLGASFFARDVKADIPAQKPGAIPAAAALSFAQVALPYDYKALEPNIDAITMEIHYTKHHAAYIKNVNDAIAAEGIKYATEKEFFANASKLSAKARNNGGGAYNHNLYWQFMKPNGGGAPKGKVADVINGSFDSFDKFKEQFTQAAMTRFGSGWAWLVKNGDKLMIGSTPNQDNPLMDVSDFKGTPLLGIDVWEHAYYLKYQNKRNEYVANWWNLVNWDAVAKLM